MVNHFKKFMKIAVFCVQKTENTKKFLAKKNCKFTTNIMNIYKFTCLRIKDTINIFLYLP